MIIDGRAISKNIIQRLKKQPVSQKTLAAILVGNNPVSISFLKQKEKIATELGVSFKLFIFSESTPETQLEEEMLGIVRNPEIGGVILQLPLPSTFDRDRLMRLIPKEKDVDALNGGPLVVPPVSGAIDAILEEPRFSLEEKHAVVIGKGMLVGMPAFIYLRGKRAHVVQMDKGEIDLPLIHAADLLVTGVGFPSLINSDSIKPGMIVIDFGSSLQNGKIVGDVDYEEISKRGAIVTPTPGGTGPIVVAKLFENFYRLNFS